MLLVLFAFYTLNKLRKTHDVSNFRFISLLIVLIEMIILTVFWIVIARLEDKLVVIIFQMVQEIIKYMGFYY